MPSLRIAHLSDLHGAPSNQLDQERIARAALDDLKRLHAVSPIDLAVFSGDLAFAGNETDLAIAKDLVLAPLESELGLGRDRIIVVPGNHDVDRGAIVDFIEAGLLSQLQTREAVNAVIRDGSQLTLATQRLSKWDVFYNGFYNGVLVEHPAPLAAVHRLTLNGKSVGIAALNSAWRASGGIDDRGRLRIGEAQFAPTLEAISGCDVKLVVVHHPASWLSEFDGDQFRQYLESAGGLLFTGHEHKPDPLLLVSRSGQVVHSRAGCLYETTDYANTFSVVTLDLDSETTTVEVRQWYPTREHGLFLEATQIAAHGAVVFEPRERRSNALATLPHSAVTDALIDVAQRTSIIRDALPETPARTVDDILVPPRLLSVPYREAVAAAGVTTGIDPKLLIDLPLVTAGEVIVVCAEPEFGVTSAILWLLGQQWDNSDGQLPIYLSSDDRIGTQRTDRALTEAAARAGYDRSQGTLPPLTLGIDDVVANRPRRLERLAAYIAAHTEHGYILGCHKEEHREIVRALESAGVGVRRVFLAPFGRRELRLLLEKLVGSGERQLLGRIFSLIRSQSLPRSPLTMAALIAVLRDEEDPGAINESGLLQAYVNYLLGGSELSDAEGLGMDYRRREHLLAHFAHLLFEAGAEDLPRLDAELALGQYFRVRDMPLSPGRVLQSLIDRRVLLEDNQTVRFRHPAFQQLFTAKWMLEDASFAAEIMGDVLRHGSVLKHAAGLKRSDRDLLEAVGESTLAALRALSDQLDIAVFDESLTRDAAEPPELEELRRRLEVLPSETDESELDDRLDRVDDALERESEEPEAPSRPIDDARGALTLLCDVLRNSELVDDGALKAKLLREGVRHWSLVAVLAALVSEDDELIRSLASVAEDAGLMKQSDDLAKEMRRFIRMITLMIVGVGAWGLLGSAHLGAAIDDALEDAEMTGSPTRAWILTMLYCYLERASWPARLIALYEKFPRHVFLREVIADYALEIYRSTPDSSQASALEPFVADVFAPPSQGGPAQIPQRAANRSQFLADIREGRRRYQHLTPSRALPDEGLDERSDA